MSAKDSSSTVGTSEAPSGACLLEPTVDHTSAPLGLRWCLQKRQLKTHASGESQDHCNGKQRRIALNGKAYRRNVYLSVFIRPQASSRCILRHVLWMIHMIFIVAESPTILLSSRKCCIKGRCPAASLPRCHAESAASSPLLTLHSEKSECQ